MTLLTEKWRQMLHNSKPSVLAACLVNFFTLTAAMPTQAASATEDQFVTNAAGSPVVSPALLGSFPGNSFATNKTQKPDCSLAVGTSYVVTTDTARIQWYSKDGTLLNDQSMSSFFNIPSNGPIADVRVVYESVNDRFVVESDQDVNGVNVLGLAVSLDGN